MGLSPVTLYPSTTAGEEELFQGSRGVSVPVPARDSQLLAGPRGENPGRL